MSPSDRVPKPEPSPATADPPTPAAVNPGRASLQPLQKLGGERYERRREIGRGGMGSVLLCHDAQIGRDVAMKIIRDDLRESDERSGRFLREARVQGQLEHPGIVPVYDLGVDANGSMFFTMKCLRGVTLAHVVKSLVKEDPAVAQTYSRRRLLTAFSSLCQIVEYAHSRGVLHRDIKPPNIMLGDFGEVYLLDWGIAKVLDSTDPDIGVHDLQSMRTMPGEILGTLGYVAPEQARGRISQLDQRSDVYSLGCILFEMLTLQPLHSRADLFEVLHTTTRGTDARASARAPERDIPPELDRICVKATMLEKAERYASAREIREAVERFLDGDRNMEMRRDLAAEHTARAEEAVEEALAGRGTSGEQARRKALREVGRALALDPDNERALGILERVFTAPPREVPAEVEAQLRLAESQRHKLQLRDAIGADLLGVCFSVPFALWMGVREWLFVITVVVFTAASIGFKLTAHRKGQGASLEAHAYLAFLFNLLATAALTRAWGPLFIMPVLMIGFTNGYSATSSEAHRRRVLISTLAVQIGAVLVEVLGLLPRSYAFESGALTILPRGVTHSQVPSLVGLTAFSLFMIFLPMRLSGRVQRMLHEAEQRALVNAWQLGQLLPNKARSLPPPS